MPVSPEIRNILVDGYKNTEVFAQAFFPEAVSRPFDPIHRQLLAHIDKRYKEKNGVMVRNKLRGAVVPRGIGKTTLANIINTVKQIVYKDRKFIMPVSANADAAVEQSDNLKGALLNNERLTKVYGDIKGEKFSEDLWSVKIGGSKIWVLPRGAGQPVRGKNLNFQRPDWIFIDDLEKSKEMKSELIRKETKEWFFRDLRQCIDEGSDDWDIFIVGTILHHDSLLVDLINHPDWDIIEVPICDPDFKVSNAPNFMSVERILEKKEEFASADDLKGFYMEYMNEPAPTGEDAVFQQSYFQYYDESERGKDVNRNHDWENVIFYDPAKTAHPTSADSAIVGVGVNVATNEILVRDIVHGRLHPEEQYEQVFQMEQRIRARLVAVEVTSLHEFITHPLKNYLSRRGSKLEVIELHARGGANERGKEARIKQLLPYYRTGLIKHNPTCCAVLEGQLLAFPSSKYWDVMDAFGYLPELLEQGLRYMLPHDPADEDYESKEALEREFVDLEEEEDLMPLDFRIV